MPSLPISNLLSRSAFKVHNKTRGIDVMTKVKVINAKVSLQSTVMRHMREDGTTIVDTRVILPFVLEVQLICPDLNVANDVLSTLNDRSSLYRVTSKGLIFDDVMLMYDSMQQTPENLSSTPTRIAFQQVLLQGGQQAITAQPADGSVMDRGIASIRDVAQSATQTVTQSVSGLFNRATESVGRAIGF
jgi:hypothetical protein